MRAGRLAAEALGFVALSSLLGLLPIVVAFQAPVLFAIVWMISPLADLAFAFGSAAFGVGAFLLVREQPRLLVPAVLLGVAAHGLVYWCSFLLLGPGDDVPDWNALEVAAWGSPGLAFAALAPPLAARRWLRAPAP